MSAAKIDENYESFNAFPFKITIIQSQRAQTNASGAYTWTFEQPYPAGRIPAVVCLVEDASGSFTWNARISAISNTAVTVQLTKTASVTVLGISVLGIQANPQATVHLLASLPSA